MSNITVEGIQQDLKDSTKKKNLVRVSTLRLLLSALNYKKIEVQRELAEQDIILVVQKEVKKRKESIELFKKGKREDLVKKEEAEMGILLEYLPKQLSPEELTGMVDKAIKETGATSVAQMGQVMSRVMSEVQGRAEGKLVSEMVKERLSK